MALGQPGDRTRDAISQQLLYPLDDPSGAFNSALRKVGINPYMTNPFVTQLQKAAPGARIAFLAHGGPAGDKYGNPSEDYGKWLQGSLQSGNLFPEMNRTAQFFGGIVQAVKKLQDQEAQGNVGALADSPYYSALSDIFGANDGLGSLSAYASLRAPMMGALAPSFTRGLQAAGTSALNKFYNEGDYTSSPFDWIFKGKNEAF
jgi:hypothetical protein